MGPFPTNPTEEVRTVQQEDAMKDTQAIILRKIEMLKQAKAKKDLLKERVEEFLSEDSAYAELLEETKDLNEQLKQAKTSALNNHTGAVMDAERKEINEEIKELKQSLNNMTLAYYDATGQDSIQAENGTVFRITRKAGMKAGQLTLF